MKSRKTNRAKRISSGCRNHGRCAWCTRGRLHQAARAVPADEAWQKNQAEQRADAEADAEAARYEDCHPDNDAPCCVEAWSAV